MVAVSVGGRDSTDPERLYRIYLGWQYGLVKYMLHDLDTYELYSR